MSVTVRLNPYLRTFTNNQTEVEVNCKTVSECINDLDKKFPGIKKQMIDEKGKLYFYLEIYLNDETCYPDELAKPVKDGDIVTILTLIAGG